MVECMHFLSFTILETNHWEMCCLERDNFDNGCFGSRHSVKKATNVRLNLDGAELQVVPTYR